MQQATKDGHGGPVTWPMEGPNSTKENKDDHNALQSVTTPDLKLAQLQSITADDLTSDIIQVSVEDNNLEKKAFENTINEANKEAKV